MGWMWGSDTSARSPVCSLKPRPDWRAPCCPVVSRLSPRPLAAQDLDWRFAEAQEEMARAAAAEAAESSGDAPAAAESKPASA